MRAHRWTKLFLKRCPLCQEVVQDGAAAVVRCLGRLYCCQAHADSDEASLHRALEAFHGCHAARHGATGCCPRPSSPTQGRIISAYADEPSRRATLKSRIHEAKQADRSMCISYPGDAHEERRQGTVAPRTTGALTFVPAVTGWDPTGDERSWLMCDTDEAHVFRQHWPLADTSPGSPDARRSRGGVERTDHRLTSSFSLTRCSIWSTDKLSLLRVVEACMGAPA
jgi:hypothetical protein